MHDDAHPTVDPKSDRERLLAELPLAPRRLQVAGVSTAVLEGGQGRPLVLLHGPAGYAAQWMRVLPGLVALHLRFHTYRLGWSDSAVRRYVRDAGGLLHELNVLTRCDCTTRDERKARRLSRRMDELEARIGELAAREELAAIRPELDGRAVMEHLGVPPGPIVGQALAHLLEIRLEEGLIGEDEARRRLDEWYASHQRTGVEQ